MKTSRSAEPVPSDSCGVSRQDWAGLGCRTGVLGSLGSMVHCASCDALAHSVNIIRT